MSNCEQIKDTECHLSFRGNRICNRERKDFDHLCNPCQEFLLKFTDNLGKKNDR